MFIENVTEEKIKDSINKDFYEISFKSEEKYQHLFNGWQRIPDGFHEENLNIYFNVSRKPKSWKEMYGWFNYIKFYTFLSKIIPTNGNFIEIGVYQGRSACFLASLRPDINFVLIDPMWIDPSGFYKHKHLYLDKNSICENISNLIPKCKFVTKRCEEIAYAIKDNHYHAVFIDGDHSYEAVKTNIGLYLPKIKQGCILSGHDYDINRWPGVVNAVDEVLGKNNINVFIEDPQNIVCPVFTYTKPFAQS